MGYDKDTLTYLAVQTIFFRLPCRSAFFCRVACAPFGQAGASSCTSQKQRNIAILTTMCKLFRLISHGGVAVKMAERNKGGATQPAALSGSSRQSGSGAPQPAALSSTLQTLVDHMRVFITDHKKWPNHRRQPCNRRAHRVAHA